VNVFPGTLPNTGAEPIWPRMAAAAGLLAAAAFVCRQTLKRLAGHMTG
jgi:LPXTG-motif cell wall-anchored protein